MTSKYLKQYSTSTTLAIREIQIKTVLEMTQFVHKHEDLSLHPSTHGKGGCSSTDC